MADIQPYLGIVVVLILTGCGLPIPEEAPIIAAGIASSVNTLNPIGAFIACIMGALAGDFVIYALGYQFGHNLIKKHPRFAHWLHAENAERNEDLIRQHAFKVLFITRFMVGIRAPVYLAAGVLRMPLGRFLLTDAVCATSVVSVFFGLSYWFGERIVGWIKNGEIWLTIVVVLAAVAAICFSWWKGKRMIAKMHDDSTNKPTEPSTNGEARRDAHSKSESLAL